MSDYIDFDMAERFLKQARAAHEAGCETHFKAARHLVAVALRLPSTDDAKPLLKGTTEC